MVTAESQGALDLTKYCGKQVWWISSKCGQTAMSALSPGVTVVESAHSLGTLSCNVKERIMCVLHQLLTLNRCKPL